MLNQKSNEFLLMLLIRFPVFISPFLYVSMNYLNVSRLYIQILVMSSGLFVCLFVCLFFCGRFHWNIFHLRCLTSPPSSPMLMYTCNCILALIFIIWCCIFMLSRCLYNYTSVTSLSVLTPLLTNPPPPLPQVLPSCSLCLSNLWIAIFFIQHFVAILIIIIITIINNMKIRILQCTIFCW